MLKKKEWEKIFSLKEWLLVFLRIDFRECSIVDFRNRKVNLYDISTGEISIFTPDFMKEDGQFNHWQYCLCLIKKTLELSYTDFPNFLKYQCAFMEAPLDWLSDFDDLLRLNENFNLMSPYDNRFRLMRGAIDQQIILLSATDSEKSAITSLSANSTNQSMEMDYLENLLFRMEKTDDYKEQVSICKEAKANYLRKVKNANELSVFVRLIEKIIDCRKEIVSKKPKLEVWEGTAKALAKHHVLNNLLRDEQGRFKRSTRHSTVARSICERYCRPNGDLFKFTTIQTAIGKFIRGSNDEIDSGN